MSHHRSPYEMQIQSLSGVVGIHSTEWQIPISNDVSGSYNLIIKLGKDFPKVAPKVTLSDGWIHSMVNSENHEVVVSELLDEWNEKQPLGDIIKDLKKLFEKNPPQLDKAQAKDKGKPFPKENEIIGELQRCLDKTEQEKKSVEEELVMQKKLITNLRKEINELKEQSLSKKKEMNQETAQIRADVEKLKESNKNMDGMLQAKDEIIKALRLKCAQLSQQNIIDQKVSKAEASASVDIKALEQFNQQLKQQVEDLKKQLTERKNIDVERAESFKELNEINEKLENQNRSFSDRIKILEEKLKELMKTISKKDETIVLLQQSLDETKQTADKEIAEMQQSMPSIAAIEEEKTQQIALMKQRIQDMEEETNKEKQKFEEKIQELERSLEEVRNESHDKQQKVDELEKESKEHDISDVEMTIRQLNFEDCDLNLKIAQLIEKNPVHRRLFELIIKKLETIFKDCRMISSKHSEINETLLKQSVDSAASQLQQTDSTFLSQVPKTELMVQLIDYVINIANDMELLQLFENVSRFEHKIAPQNAMTFAKLFSLKLFGLEIIHTKQQKMKEIPSAEAREQYETQLHLWVERACERVFIVLATGSIFHLLTDSKSTNARSLSLSSSSSSSPSAFSSIGTLEHLVEGMFVMLRLENSKEEFQDALKQHLNKEKERQRVKSIERQASKEKEDEFEIVNACANTSSHVLKEGWLEKAGEHFFSQSQRRKFTLLSDGSLFYEKGDGKNLVRNKIDLTDAKGVKKVGNFEMLLEMPDRKWGFKCETINDRDQWIDAMTSVPGVKCQSCDNPSN